MKYYKIIDGKNFIGIATSEALHKIQLNPKLLISCIEQDAQYILFDNSFYHATWMRTINNDIDFKSADVIEIDEYEYNILNESIENGDDIEMPEDTEEYVVGEPNITSEEQVTIEYVKACKLNEISSICNKVITNGFDVELSDNETYHFSLTTQDQLNLTSLSTMVASGETTIPYHADGELCKFYSIEDILTIINTATSFKTYHITYHNALKLYVQSLDNIEDIYAIEYGIEIPEEYQSDVLKTIYANKE